MKSDSLEATEKYSAAKSTHPRVSLDDMKAKIAATHYFTAAQAIVALGQPLPGTPVLDETGKAVATNSPLDLLTICILLMQNGFTIIGKSAPASPENFDEEKGKLFAYEDAVKQLWPLEGYLLRERLHWDKAVSVPAGKAWRVVGSARRTDPVRQRDLLFVTGQDEGNNRRTWTLENSDFMPLPGDQAFARAEEVEFVREYTDGDDLHVILKLAGL